MPRESAPKLSMKGLHPMKFPRDDYVIPVTEKELRAQGVNFCLHKIMAQNQCLAKAKVNVVQFVFLLVFGLVHRTISNWIWIHYSSNI